jgi:predicted RNA methylase
LYESLLQTMRHAQKKKRGSYYTPAPLAQTVAARAMSAVSAPECPSRTVIDPACGAAAILVEALRFTTAENIYGMDIDPFAVWLARFTLAMRSSCTSDRELDGWCQRVIVCDALSADSASKFSAFSAVIGNPPWVVFAGRQSATLSEEARAEYRKQFQSFAGFPSTHGMFVERAAQMLAPGGRLALLVPLQLADLNGYRYARGALNALAVVDEPLEELGFDQFEGVTEPTLLLCATRRVSTKDNPSTTPWVLLSKQARAQLEPSLVARLKSLPPFSEDTFREGGFQSAGTVAETLLTNWPLGPDANREHPFALMREGKDIEPYLCRPPTMALRLDQDELRRHRVTLRSPDFFQAIPVIIRQTARYPIAALHDPPHAFRNSLLAGFHANPRLLCALLNSTLVRAWHLAHQRDGQQQIFPQLKVSHLRALPAPPSDKLTDAMVLSITTLAAQAEKLQQERAALVQAFGPAPKTAFAPADGEIAGSAAFAKALKLRDRRENNQTHTHYQATLAAVRGCYAKYKLVLEQIDSLVFALYSVTEAEAASARAVLRPEPAAAPPLG